MTSIMGEKRTVLVVDDTPEMLDALVEILRPHFKVKAALNGERALKIAADDPAPDLILSDVEMPLMDGYRLCHELKANPATKRIPVIFLTSLNQVRTRKRDSNWGGRLHSKAHQPTDRFRSGAHAPGAS